MKQALTVAALSVGLVLGFASVATADDDDDVRTRADHTTFTSQSEDFFACGCPRKNICRVHATITNLAADPAVDIKFQDGDLVTIFVPPGTSLSLTQMMGTRDDTPVDDVVVFDPRDSGSLNPIVAWVSIERLGEAKKNDTPEFGCTTFPL
jgi:hypothetical protein